MLACALKVCIVLVQSGGVVQENGKHLPWKFESLEKEGQEQQNGGEEAAQQDFDPTKFILVDKEVIQKIDVMKSKYNLTSQIMLFWTFCTPWTKYL
jgi:hypothetical protein